MDEVLFYAQYLLGDRERGRFNRHWIDEGDFAAEFVAHLRARFTDRQLREHHARIVSACEELRITRLDLLNGTLPTGRIAPLADPPGALFLRGDRRLLDHRPSVGVVGTRRGTERGRRCARGFGAWLARAGVLVVSGMALGVDGAAHEGCLDARGPALAWLAGGVETVTPPRHRTLYRRLLEEGLLASEYPPHTPVRRHHFVARNRLISAFSDALLVVEAGERSGTRSTVEFTLDLGRELYCMPGPVDCPHSAGTLRWIREGATMVRHGEDLLADLGIEAPLPVGPVCFGLGARPESTAGIARRCRLPLAEVAATLARAETRGEVRRLAGDRWCAAGLAPVRPGA